MIHNTETEITINGRPLDAFRNLTLTQEIDAHHLLQVVVPRDVLEKPLSDAQGGAKDSHQEDIGANAHTLIDQEVTLKIEPENHIGNYKESTVFNGVITGLRLIRNASAGTGDEIVLQVYSPTYKADGAKHCQMFKDKKISDVAKAILSSYKLTNKIQTTADKHPYIVQYNESDFQFLSRLGARYGIWHYYDGENWIFGKSDDSMVKLSFGRDLFEFEINSRAMDYNYQFAFMEFDDSKVGKAKLQKQGAHTSRHRLGNPLSKVFGKSDLPYYSGFTKKSDNNDNNENTFLKSIAHRQITVSGRSDNPGLKLGALIEIDGQKYRLLQITHTTDETGQYMNSFLAMTSSGPNDPYPKTNLDNYPRVHPMQAVVTKIGLSPDGYPGVAVKFPWSDEETPILKVVNAHAGDHRGVFLYPEVGDLVLVGFEDGNPDLPFVDGSFHHNKTKPPFKLEENNNIKGYWSRSGFYVELDEENHTLTVESANKKYTFTIDEKGESISISAPGGDINLNANNIRLEADGSIEMKANNDFKADFSKGLMNAKAEMTIKSGAKMDLKSGLVGIKGDGQIKLEGGIVDLAASGVAMIKGTMLNLNTP